MGESQSISSVISRTAEDKKKLSIVKVLTGYFEQEVLHLMDLGVDDFIQVGVNLWKAVK